MKNIKLILSYDGTNYHGWQRQNKDISVQEVLEDACKKLFNQEVKTKGAGRTDAGVHALGQCASLVVDTQIPVEKIPLALNRILPMDIVVTQAEIMPPEFHPQYAAKKKTYQYQIVNAKFPIPQLRNYAYFVYTPLNVEAMNQAAQEFVGTHDFIGFCSSRNTKKITERTIYHANVVKDKELITFEICGDGFLYNMVRIMVGTLIEIGTGKMEPTSIKEIIRSKERQNAGDTVPPFGLTMCEIEYEAKDVKYVPDVP